MLNDVEFKNNLQMNESIKGFQRDNKDHLDGLKILGFKNSWLEKLPHPKHRELEVDVVVQCAEEPTHHAHQQEQRQLPQVVAGVVKLSKVEESAIAQLAGVAAEDGEQHIEREIAGHRAKEYSPGKGLVPERRPLLQAEEDAADGRSEGGGHARRCPARDKVPLLLVLAEEGKGFRVNLEGS